MGTKKDIKRKTARPRQEINNDLTYPTGFYVVCIGASAGGLNAVNELVSQLPPQLNAAVFIVLHLSKTAMGEILLDKIKRQTGLRCMLAADGMEIKPGYVYLARPDHHMLIKENRITLGNGPPENRFRPSIDVLFRSAAAGYGERTIGIVLTGYLSDGTSGMWAIKQSGGKTIVQHPDEAEYPDMPLSVIETMEVDHCVPLKNMGDIIKTITSDQPSGIAVVPAVVVAESMLSEKAATDITEVQRIGEKTIYSCPDCGGGLWNIKNNGVDHYRCHIGHSYSEPELIVKQSETISHTLWVAIRMMEERKVMLSKLAGENGRKGLQQMSVTYRDQAAQLESHIDKLKGLLFAIEKN
jgi:two-component system chemotaxis response regulator CheB